MRKDFGTTISRCRSHLARAALMLAIVVSLAAPGADAASALHDASAKSTPAKKSPSKAKAGAPAAKPPGSDRRTRAAPTNKTARKPASTDPESLRRTQTAQAAQRARLAAKLAEVQRAIAASEASRSDAADALAKSERSISDANRRLHALSAEQETMQARLAELAIRRSAKAAEIEARQTALARVVHDRYVSGSTDPIKLYLSGGNPNDIARDRIYLAYLARATAELLAALHDNAARLDDLSEQTHLQNEALARVASEQEATRAALAREQDARRETLARASKKLEGQRLVASKLAADEKRLASVVEQLQRVLDRQAKERALERARQAKARSGRGDVAKRGVARQGGEQRVDDTSTGATNGDFAAQKGHLRLPVRGILTARYGSQRDDGGASWKGVYIRAETGATVHAIAAGRVVFSDWLRGFGNLLIVDHGDQYLSIYGNNESLLKRAGDTVRAGDALAKVGNSAGNPETGLYFELRYRGKPFDPLSWTSLR